MTGWLSVRIMWLWGKSRSWCRWPGFPVGQHYKVTMSAHYHKLVHTMIWPRMLLAHKIPNTSVLAGGHCVGGVTVKGAAWRVSHGHLLPVADYTMWTWAVEWRPVLRRWPLLIKHSNAPNHSKQLPSETDTHALQTNHNRNFQSIYCTKKHAASTTTSLWDTGRWLTKLTYRYQAWRSALLGYGKDWWKDDRRIEPIRFEHWPSQSNDF